MDPHSMVKAHSTSASSFSSLSSPPSWLGTLSDPTSFESWPPQSGAPYDWQQPSRDNYHQEGTPFVGRFEQARQQLDYSYHRKLAEKRQILQDTILENVVASHEDEIGNGGDGDDEYNERQPWIVFTAGPMGVGKSYVLSKLYEAGYFPLDKFLKIDPDMLKAELPEFPGYQRENPSTAATLLHGESSQLADILFQHGLANSMDMMVDGSLRDVDYYSDLISNQLRTKHSQYRIAIIHVTADPDIIRQRARERAKSNGRAVPTELLEESIAQVPKSVHALRHLVDAVFNISNNEGESLTLLDATNDDNDYLPSSFSPSQLTWSEFSDTWHHDDDGSRPLTKNEEHLICSMANAWTDSAAHNVANRIWRKSYPSFCPRCSLACDGVCGVCIHGSHICACIICKEQEEN